MNTWFFFFNYYFSKKPENVWSFKSWAGFMSEKKISLQSKSGKLRLEKGFEVLLTSVVEEQRLSFMKSGIKTKSFHPLNHKQKINPAPTVWMNNRWVSVFPFINSSPTSYLEEHKYLVRFNRKTRRGEGRLVVGPCIFCSVTVSILGFALPVLLEDTSRGRIRRVRSYAHTGLVRCKQEIRQTSQRWLIC